MNPRRLLTLFLTIAASAAFAAPALAHGDEGERRHGDGPPAFAGVQEPSSEAPDDDRFGSRCARAERKLDRLERRALRLERRIDRLEALLASGELDEEDAIEMEERLEWLEERLERLLDKIDWLDELIAQKCTPDTAPPVTEPKPEHEPATVSESGTTQPLLTAPEAIDTRRIARWVALAGG